jgi:hypothetical protein
MIKLISTFLVITLLSFSVKAEETLVSKYDNNIGDIISYPGAYYKNLKDIIKIHLYLQGDQEEKASAYFQYLSKKEEVFSWTGQAQLVKLEMVGNIKNVGEVEVWATWITLQSRKIDKRYYIPLLVVAEQEEESKLKEL